MEQAGIINLLKPAGMTSHDSVHYLRRLTGIKKIGHTGTLDPMAVGVLPVCLGQATRIIDYLEGSEKGYRCEMLLGIETDTQDIWGTVTSSKRETIGEIREENIKTAMAKLCGDIMQTPPAFSAVKIDGRRLYDYARKGETVVAEPRPAFIRNIEMISFDQETGRVVFDVLCGRGTYIRSLCVDMGRQLGCGATMSFLVRVSSGSFLLSNTATFEQLETSWQDYMSPIDSPLTHLGKITIDEQRIQWFSNGGYLRENEVVVESEPQQTQTGINRKTIRGEGNGYTVYSNGLFLGIVIYNKEQNLYLADKVLCK